MYDDQSEVDPESGEENCVSLVPSSLSLSGQDQLILEVKGEGSYLIILEYYCRLLRIPSKMPRLLLLSI